MKQDETAKPTGVAGETMTAPPLCYAPSASQGTNQHCRCSARQYLRDSVSMQVLTLVGTESPYKAAELLR